MIENIKALGWAIAFILVIVVLYWFDGLFDVSSLFTDTSKRR
jgi:hypothetical protein